MNSEAGGQDAAVKFSFVDTQRTSPLSAESNRKPASEDADPRKLTGTVSQDTVHISRLEGHVKQTDEITNRLEAEVTRPLMDVSELRGTLPSGGQQWSSVRPHRGEVTPADDLSPSATQSMPEFSRGFTATVVVLWMACMAFSLWAVTVGWNNTIFDNHGFRQSQTAITTYYLRFGNFFSYETPVLGPPWSIPFELPVYETIVAASSKSLHLPLDQTGRLISVIFFYATLLPFFVVMRKLGTSRLAIFPTLALFAISPFYLFWSRTFMIESTALFLAVTYLAFVATATAHNRVTEINSWILAVGIMLSGALAALTKITTFASFLLAAMLLVLHKLWRDWKTGRLKSSTVGLLVTSTVLVPVIFSYSWTVHTDRVKSLNPMGRHLTSQALERWNFGTLAQRLSLDSYTNFAFMGIGHVIDNLVGNRFVILLAFALLIGLGLRSLRMLVICLILYTSAVAIFFNLHVIHTYYAYANGIFLIAAIGFCISAALETRTVRRWAAVCVFAFAICGCVVQYFREYYQLQKTNAPGRPSAAAVIDRETNSTDALLVYGLDWSSEFPYQAHRRAIMAWKAPGEHALQQAIANEGVSHISALVVCDQDRSLASALVANMRSAGFSANRQFTADNCDIYLP